MNAALGGAKKVVALDISEKALEDARKNFALNNLKIEIHPALKSAYSSIYGYTSDENGTRHANGIGEKNATFSEAKYMLISCSAFVNYLKENFEKGK